MTRQKFRTHVELLNQMLYIFNIPRRFDEFRKGTVYYGRPPVDNSSDASNTAGA